MAESPVIETSRLRIIPFSMEFLSDRYVGWLNDPEVTRYSEQRFRKHSLRTCTEYFRSFADSPNYFWAVVTRRAGPGHIGNMNAYVSERIADVGILIGEKTVWKMGYATEAWLAVCRYLLSLDNIDKVSAGTLSLNIGMIKVMINTGMTEDRPPTETDYEGKPVYMLHYSLAGKTK